MTEIDILPNLTLIVGGYPLIRQGVATVTSKLEWFSVGMETGNLFTARDYCASHSPQLIILDLELDCGDVISVLKEFKRQAPSARILALSDRESVELLQRAFRAGADAFVSKRDPISELESAAWRLLRGEQSISRRLQEQLMASLTCTEDKKPSLSEREFAVLQLIGQGRRVSSIARELCVSVKTIETHQRRIRIKLGLRNSEELRRHAAGSIHTQS